MDDMVFRMIIAKIDKLESKVDLLLEFKWKIAGMAIVVGVVSAAVFELAVAVIGGR